MKEREFCRIFGNCRRFTAFLICIFILSFSLTASVCSEITSQNASDENSVSLAAIYAMGGYNVKLNNAVFVDYGKDDGKMLTDRSYSSISSNASISSVSGWMMVKSKDGKNTFSATVDIDFGYIAQDVRKFYLRAFRNPRLEAEMPSKIQFYYSLDGKDYIKVGDAKTLSDVTASNCAAIYDVTLDSGVTAKYLRAVIESKSSRAFWINEIGAAAYKEIQYAATNSDGKASDVNGILYTVKDGVAAVSGYDAKVSRTIATKSDDDFNADGSEFVLGIGTGNAVKVISDFIEEGRINYSGVPNNIKYIVIHNTGTVEEETDADQYNHRMHTTPEETSWHYTVDDGIIYHSLADSAVGWHAGSGVNYESIGIEICVNGAPKKSSGSFLFTGEKYEKWVNERFDKSLRNAAVLVAELLTRYGLDESAIIQHYDASGKNCPQWMRYKNGKYVHDGTLWVRFMGYVSDYYNKLNADSTSGIVTYDTEINVPDYISVDGDVFPVTEISASAFANIDLPIKSIVLGNEVKTIAYGCFDGNEELESVGFKSGNKNFRVDSNGAIYTVGGELVYDPNTYTGIAPAPQESCTLDIRKSDGKYYIFCKDEGYTLSQLADNYGANEFSANRLDGKAVGPDEIVGTGALITLNGAQLYLVLLGDTNGDAEINTYDYLLIKRTCLNTYSPLNHQLMAMRLAKTDEITKYDYILLKRHIMGTYNIFE